jgi:TPR repeat protein
MHWYKLSAAKGYTESHYKLGVLYERLEEEEADALDSSEYHYQQAIKQARADACMLPTPGGITATGERATSRLEALRRRLRRRNAQTGISESLLRSRGANTEADRRALFEQMQAAADHGDADSQHCMGVLLRYGGDVVGPRNRERAEEYLNLAIAQGHMGAQHFLDAMNSSQVNGGGRGARKF